MRAWRIDELGHPSTALRLEDVEPPSPGPGQVAIAVEATVLNFADILLCQGIYQDRPGVPFTPGLETCGIVTRLGAGVTMPLGTRVAGMAALPAGGFGQHALIRAPSAVEMPADIPASHATVLTNTYLTSHVALHHRAQLRSGETVLVLGAAGGVGSTAVQLAAAAGATVIAVAGGAEKTAFARSLGAEHVIDHRAEDLRERVLAITGGGGVDVVYDPVGGDQGDAARRLLAWEGRLLVIGFASGGIPTYPANHVLVKNYSVIGLHWGAYTEHGRRDVLDAAHEDLLRGYRSGAIEPPIHQELALDDIRDGLGAVEARSVLGRLVYVESDG